MSHKQQVLMNTLTKCVRQYFLYKDDQTGKDPVKVRLRSDVHRVEQAAQTNIDHKLLQRIRDNKIGLLHPQHKPYEPVGGWPVLSLDNLVLNALAPQLDEKVWQMIRNQTEKIEFKRTHERRDTVRLLKDFSSVHECPYAGYQKIKAHLLESEARMQYVKAGFDFEQHFNKTHKERMKRDAPCEDTLKQFDADPDIVRAKERVRRDTILFLVTVKDILEKMLMLKLRHLKSPTPINLAVLGTDKDRDSSKPTGRAQPQYPGGPLLQYSFKDQILTEAPFSWPGKMSERLAGRNSRHTHHVSRDVSIGSQRSALVTRDRQRPLRVAGSMASRAGSDSGSSSEKEETHFHPRRIFHDDEMKDRFRKRWPPVWMSLASMEQGFYMVDPACPTKEYNACLSPTSPRRRKSFTDILNTRKVWAAMRKNVSKTLDENLWREDKEKMEFFRVEYATLSHVPLSKPYPTHQRQIDDLVVIARSKRQKKVIYDCELSEWYKYLAEQIHELVGRRDEEINGLLESIKVHFKMSATSPKFGRAKLALLTMSMPAYVLLHIHVQRALMFILTRVLNTPGALLTGWLATRSLPLVLLHTDTI